MADTSTWVQRAKESKPSDMKSLMDLDGDMGALAGD